MYFFVGFYNWKCRDLVYICCKNPVGSLSTILYGPQLVTIYFPCPYSKAIQNLQEKAQETVGEQIPGSDRWILKAFHSKLTFLEDWTQSFWKKFIKYKLKTVFFLLLYGTAFLHESLDCSGYILFSTTNVKKFLKKVFFSL